MTLNEHIAAGPAWISWWINWIGVINIAAVVFFARWREGRLRFGHIEAVYILAALVAVIVAIEILFRQFGYTRILGLSHVLIWTPLAIYLWRRLSLHPRNTVFGIYLRVLLVTIVVALAFDYADVVRFLTGDTQMSQR